MRYRIETKDRFQIMGLSGYDSEECAPGDRLTPLWRAFMDNCNARLWNGGDSRYTAPLWQVAAYAFHSENGKTRAIIGAEHKGGDPEGMDVETVPGATWAVFTLCSPTGIDHVPKAYARILTEWLPASRYRRDEAVPSLEVFPPGDAASEAYQWEIWLPVVGK